MTEYEIFFYDNPTCKDCKEYWEFETETEMWEYVKMIMKEDHYSHAEVTKIHYLNTLEYQNGEFSF